MRVRRHFRTSTANINLILSDFSFSRIHNKDTYFKYCVDKRIQLLNENYDAKLDKILSFIIMNCKYDNLPLDALSNIILSLSKVTNILSKGFMYVLTRYK